MHSVSSLQLVAVCVAGFVFSVLSDCGTLCSGNNECAPPECTLCQKPPGSDVGRCAPSLPCNSICVVNSDCDQTQCADCVKEAGAPTGLCRPQCAGPCRSSTDCNPGTGCASCVLGRCRGARECGEACLFDSQCGTASGPNCSECIQGYCGSPCGGGCLGDANCGHPACPRCDLTSNTCQALIPCGRPCTVNNECDTSCQICTNRTCDRCAGRTCPSGSCPAGCTCIGGSCHLA